MVAGTKIIRDTVVIGYITNEAISILENAGLMGLYIPPFLRNAINILKQRSEKVEGLIMITNPRADYVTKDAVLTEDSFNFLDQSGRKLYWNQGYKGQGVIVAVVDSGVDPTHPELRGRVLPLQLQFRADDP